MNPYRLLAAFVLAFLIITTVFSQSNPKAKDFALKDQDGKVIKLSDYKSKVVIVNFWATWCGPCIKEIPDFVNAYQKYKAKGVEIIGVATDKEGWTVVKSFVKKNKIIYPIVLTTAQYAAEYDNITGIPTTYFIDKQGNVANKKVGSLSMEELEKLIYPLLK
ncbi:MAG: TlpA disulfide reductase family protein [bacterium]